MRGHCLTGACISPSFLGHGRGGGWVLFTHNLRHVQDHDGRFETDTETSNETTDRHGGQGGAVGGGGDLDNNTDNVDETTNDDGPLAANELGNVTGDEGAEEGTGRENGDNQGLVGLAEGRGGGTVDGADEGAGTRDTVDVTRVVAEEETTDRGKGAHQVGLPGDGGLDVVDVVGGLQTSSGVGGRVVFHIVGDVGLLERHGGRWAEVEIKKGMADTKSTFAQTRGRGHEAHL